LAPSSTATGVDAGESVAQSTLECIQQLTLWTCNPTRFVPDSPPVGLWSVEGISSAAGRQLTLFACVTHLTYALAIIPVAFTIGSIAASRAIHEFTAWPRELNWSLVASTFPSVYVADTLARAVIWTVGVLTGVPKVRLLANTLACLGNTGTMSIACIATHKWIVDSIAVGTLTSLASSVDLYCIWR